MYEMTSLDSERSSIIHELKVQMLADNTMTRDIWNSLFAEEQYLYSLISTI